MKQEMSISFAEKTACASNCSNQSRTIEPYKKEKAALGAGLHLGLGRLFGQELLHTMLKFAGSKAQVKQASLQP